MGYKDIKWDFGNQIFYHSVSGFHTPANWSNPTNTRLAAGEVSTLCVSKLFFSTGGEAGGTEGVLLVAFVFIERLCDDSTCNGIF